MYGTCALLLLASSKVWYGHGQFLPLRSVSEGEEELVHKEHQVQDLDNVVDDGRGFVSERPTFVVVR